MSKKDNTRFQENMSIGDALKGFMKANNLEKGIEKLDTQNAWYAVMGQAIEAYTDSVVLQNSTLIVRLTSSPLREELSYGKTKIIENINEHLGKDVVKTLILA